MVITEKLDGTNAQILITPDQQIFAGSRNKWITPKDDNYGFARWVEDNKEELLKLGEGRHFGEWWGSGIQRRYGMKDKVFSLFNTARWTPETLPKCCSVVPILYTGPFSVDMIDATIQRLIENGSTAAPGFMDPEGVVTYHVASQMSFKTTIKDDGVPKSLIGAK